jgi:PTH2 family peptidyl-tRNA hydrolase|tara:strand:+ start:1942 stop:2316 length:375 start_codon:yes stop_codon:yes gene_type:complete
MESTREIGEVKMVCIVNHGLKMGKGKIAAQVGHAAVIAALNAIEKTPALFEMWRSQGQCKVVLKATDSSEIEGILHQAEQNGAPVCKVHDAGRTQIPSGSLTVGAIGPAGADELASLTGHLKLL